MAGTVSSFGEGNRGTGCSSVVRRTGGFLVMVVLFSVFTLSTSTASTVWDSLREEREYRSAVGLLKAEDYELARQQYEQFLEQFPNSDRRHRAYFGLAETHYLQDRYDSAADYYLRALQGLEEAEEYRRQSLNRGFHSLNESNRTGLIDDYMGHVEQYDGDLPEELGRRIVRALDAAGRTESAYEQARRHLEKNLESPYWRYQVGVLSAERDAADTAMEYLRPLLRTDNPYQNDARYALAELFYEQGDYEQAGQYYQTLLVDDQYRHRARYGLAWVDIQKGNMSKARDRLGTLADGESAVRVQAARDLARIHRSEGNTEKARTWYQQAIDWAVGSRQSRLRLEYGNFLVESDRLTDAIPHFEQADSLEDEARRSLIRAYLVDGQYNEAVRRLVERRNQGDLTERIWSVRLATGFYYLGDYKRALDELPEDVPTENPDVRKRFLYLKGSLNYRLKNWPTAESAYETAAEEFPGWEPKYFRALIEEKQGNRQTARERLLDLRKAGPPDPWASRVAYQLARLAFLQEEYDDYRTYVDEIEPSEFEKPMEFEYEILRYADQLRTTPDDVDRARAKTLRDSAARYNQIVRWYDYMTVSPLDVRWWDDLILPALKEYENLRERRGIEAVADLRRAGYYDRGFRLAERYYNQLDSSPRRRRVLNELLTILRERGTPERIGEYLPDRSDWSHWTDVDPAPLIKGLSEYYHTTDRAEEGRNALVHLRRVLQNPSPSVKRLLDEAEAGFLVQRGGYERARNLLDGIPRNKLSRSGAMNQAITRYHLGDTTASFNRLVDLAGEGDTPPVVLYDYVFRYLRDARDNERLHEWNDRFLRERPYSDTDVRSLIVKNLRYWVNNDDSTGALEVIDRLDPRSQTVHERVPLQYFRGLAYYNRGDLEDARDQLTSLRKSLSLPSPWKKRTLHYEIEIHLRTGDWKRAYRRWQDLNELGTGGRSGRRLLTVSGLETSPDRFQHLVDVMADSYAEYLNRGDTLYWRGRLREARNQYESAIELYEGYFQGGYSDYRRTAGARLARLHDRTGNHEKAFETYDALVQATNDGTYRIRKAAQLRKLERYGEAEEVLRSVLEKEPALRGEAHYELGYLNLRRNEYGSARDHYRKALEHGASDQPWITDARKRYVELSLNRGDLEAAKRELRNIQSESLRNLYRAELFRQSGDHEQAQKIVDSLEKQIDSLAPDQRRRFRQVASSVYFENNRPRDLLALHDTVPQTPENQMLYYRSLLTVDRSEDAVQVLDALDPSIRNEAKQRLAEYFYQKENWERALDLYEELPSTPETLFRQADVLRQLERYDEAFTAWEGGFRRAREQADPDPDRLTDALTTMVRTARGAQRWESFADLLDEYWDLPFRQRDRLAAIGLIGSVRIGNEPMMDRFLERLDGIELNRFVTAAEGLEERQDWDRLERLLAAAKSHKDTHRYGYFEGVLGLHNVRDYSDFSTRLNEILNEAIQQESSYAPRLQRLLGDFYYDREQYNRAAIEYRKIELLFEDGHMSPETKRKLARSYDAINDTDKARSLYQELTGETVPRTLRKEAQQWLESHTDEAS